MCFGLVLYTYSPGRFMVFMLASLWLWAVLRTGPSRLNLLVQGVACAAAALLVFAPLGYYYAHHFVQFTGRQAELSIFNPVNGPAATSFGRSLKDTLLMFSVHGDDKWDTNIPGQPMFDP